MAGASLDWADKPNADLVLSDEEDIPPSPSVAPRGFEIPAKQNLTLALGKLRLEQKGLNQSSEQDVSSATPLTEDPNKNVSGFKTPRKALQLLDLPLDVLKEIIKAVMQTFPADVNRELTRSV